MNLKCKLHGHDWVKLYSDKHDQRVGVIYYECRRCQKAKEENYYKFGKQVE